MKFSIIVPVYKVEDYLRDCIDSIILQSYTDFELILVDDGSPDNCPQICDEYAEKDTRIRVIHQKNKGLSGARNTGLDNTSADGYVVFIDSDDILYPDMLTKVANDIKNSNYPDIVIGNITHWDGNTEKIMVDNDQYIKNSKQKTLLELNELYAADFVQIPWMAYQTVYKNQFLKQNELKFDENIIGAEDCDFYLKVIEKANTYKLTPTVFVKYRFNRDDSIINAPNFNSVMGQLIVFKRAFEKSMMFPNMSLMKTYFANRFANIIILIELLNKNNEKETCYDFVILQKDLLKYTSKSAKYIFAKIIWNCFGFKRGNKLLLRTKKILKK